jgi:ribonucleoside-diphosphate reductase alpha chain
MAATPQTALIDNSAAEQALTVRRLFTQPGVDPFDTVEWELRDARIGHGDRIAFEQADVEFPKTWSQNATNIVAQKYFRGQLGSPVRERSVKQMIGRVAGTIADWGRQRGYFATVDDGDAFEAELTYVLLHQMAAFNSPVWFNVGFEESPQCSACFILSVEDNMDSILAWNTKEGKIFRGGSGSGINLSRIRGSMEPLAKGGTASGPVSFMRGADSWAGTIKSGGKTRRAAKMVVLDVDHPDIRDFIWCKAKEEDKAAALAKAGFDMSIDGEGFFSIQYQNANNSVRVTEEFMRAVEADEDWDLTARSDGHVIETVRARDLMNDIAEAAWRCADPGVQYDTTINQWHTSPNSGRINASNPCSEYMHVDDSACNLASINLMRFRREDGTFDVETFEHVVDVMFLAQEIVVGPSSYPTEEIAVNARAFRQLGLGYANLGAYLMSNGMPYDSDAGRGTAAAITALMTGRAYLGSARVAGALGPYERYAENREAHNGVMRMHRDASYSIPDSTCADTALLDAARKTWDRAVDAGEAYGYRNAQATVLAPTGTISFLMDCDTTGVEPDFSLVKFKELVGGGTMTIVNRTVPLALQTLGYTDEQVERIEAHINEAGTIVGAPGLVEEHMPVFDVAVGERAISHMGHIKMMGAVQPFISGAISKTVNMPQTATVGDIADAYTQAWTLGVKALAIYRDGSKTAQALRTEAQDEAAAPAKPGAEFTQQEVDAAVADALSNVKAEIGPTRRRMPRERQSITHKFSIGGHEGYITAGMYEDGTVGEIFLTDIGKEGSTLRGLLNSYATAISIALQYGVPLETLVQKFAYMRFEPEGSRRTRRSRSPSRCRTTSCAGSRPGSSTRTARRSWAS